MPRLVLSLGLDMDYYCGVFQTDLIELKRPNFSFPRVEHLFQWSNPFRTLNYHGRRQPALIIIWTLLFIGYLPTMQTERASSQGDFWPSERNNDSDCATCQRERALSVLKDDEIKRWRIETTKKQILERLDMQDRPPRVKTKDAHFHGLPPIAIQLTDNAQSAEPEVEPTRQLILFPEKMFRRSSHANKSLTLKFHVTNEMNESALHSAVLWTPETPLMAASPNSTSTGVNWHASDVMWTVDRQIELRHRSLSLSINATNVHHLGQVNQPRPYLVVQLDPSIKRWSAESSDRVSRRKRQTTPMCSSTVTQCCRESLHISFKDVGWNDWIIAPEGFQAYYCRGSCRTISAPGTGATSHSSLLQNLLARDRVPPAARPHLAPCCAPTRLSPLTVFYSDENNVIKQRTLPNMIVESCGCAL